MIPLLKRDKINSKKSLLIPLKRPESVYDPKPSLQNLSNPKKMLLRCIWTL
jgi:hypothetical protein